MYGRSQKLFVSYSDELHIERTIPVLQCITAYYVIIMYYLYVLLRIHEYSDMYSGY